MSGWKDMPEGAVIFEAGSTRMYNTGEWRSWRPVFNQDKCTNCMLCWVFCPDSSIIVKEKKVVGVNYYYCKGCGICAHECPTEALEMKPEYLYRQEDSNGS